MSRVTAVALILVALLLLGAVRPSKGVDEYTVDYTIYHNYSAVMRALSRYAHHPFVTLHQSPTLTAHQHPVYVARYTDPGYDSDRKVQALLTFGEHPRELVTIESCLALLDNLTTIVTDHTGSAALPHWSRYVGQYADLHLVCVFNPDGLLVQQQTADTGDRSYCQRHNGNRVDLNRNSGWEFHGPGSSPLPGHEEYHGTSAWSEAESQLLYRLATQHSYTAYISLHSGEQQVFVPFVDSVSGKTQRVRHHRTDSDNAMLARILAHTDSYFHHSGVGWRMNGYQADGTYYDWMAGVKDVKYTLCVEMWGDASKPQPLNQCFTQFNPRPSQLATELAKIALLYEAIFRQMIESERGVTFEQWQRGEIPFDDIRHEQSLTPLVAGDVSSNNDDDDPESLLDELLQLESDLIGASLLLTRG